MVGPKKKKVHAIASKVLMMFLFCQIQMSTDILFVKLEDNVVSTELGPFAKLKGAKNKGRATSLQLVLVPW